MSRGCLVASVAEVDSPLPFLSHASPHPHAQEAGYKWSLPCCLGQVTPLRLCLDSCWTVQLRRCSKAFLPPASVLIWPRASVLPTRVSPVT